MDRISITFTSATAAIELWSFGEDELAEQMAKIEDHRLREIWCRASVYNDKDFPLPVAGRNITGGHVIVFACMDHLEGRLRPLSRQRRRAAKSQPQRYIDLQEATQYQLTHNFRHGAVGPSDSQEQ